MKAKQTDGCAAPEALFAAKTPYGPGCGPGNAIRYSG